MKNYYMEITATLIIVFLAIIPWIMLYKKHNAVTHDLDVMEGRHERN